MSTRFIPRTATLADLDEVGALLAASYARLFPRFYAADVLASALPLMTRANPELLNSGFYHAVEVDHDRMVGCGGWSHADPATRAVEPGTGHIRHFATDPEWLGRGIGRLIYARCEAQALAQGVARFTCWSSLNGQGFYAALGFTPVRNVEAMLAGRVAFSVVEMTRRLAAERG